MCGGGDDDYYKCCRRRRRRQRGFQQLMANTVIVGLALGQIGMNRVMDTTPSAVGRSTPAMISRRQPVVNSLGPPSADMFPPTSRFCFQFELTLLGIVNVRSRAHFEVLARCDLIVAKKIELWIVEIADPK